MAIRLPERDYSTREVQGVIGLAPCPCYCKCCRRDLGGLSHATKGRETLGTFDVHLHRGEKGEWEDNDIVQLKEVDGGIISGIISEEEPEIQEK